MHCYRKQLASPVAVNDIILPSSKSKGMRIALRPFVKEFLSSVSKLFEVIVFTASSKSYADAVIDQLDPDKLYVSHRLYREHCHRTELGLLVKDLRVIGNRKLENLVLVDNAHHSYMFQQANGIPILPFRNDYEDNEL
jgi:CTD small phosphatase-like protein 2